MTQHPCNFFTTYSLHKFQIETSMHAERMGDSLDIQTILSQLTSYMIHEKEENVLVCH